jgi:KDO2-lipid IV(A) lauroyltransferase
MLLHSPILGRLATLAPNRKFAATRSAVVAVGLVSTGEAPALTRANALCVWSYYLRFARLFRRWARSHLYDQVVPFGEEQLAAAVAVGRGVILLSVHLGDFDLGGGWLAARRALTPVVVTRSVHPRWRDALFSLVRRRCGLLLRDAGSTRLEELELDLRQGRAVLMMLDRRPDGATEPSRILGQPAVVPCAAAALAVRSGAPLLPAATWRADDGRPVVWFGQPRSVSDHAEGIACLVEASEQLGQLIRAHPEQWHVPADLDQMSSSLCCDPAPAGSDFARCSVGPAAGLFLRT